MHISAISIDITPEAPVYLGAAGKFDSSTSKKDSRLEANIACIWDTLDSVPLILVTVDLLYAGSQLTHELGSLFSQALRENIIVCASHTHRAPMTDPLKPGLGKHNSTYTSQLVTQLYDAVVGCLNKPTPLSLSTAGLDSAPLTINRRLKKRLVVSKRPAVNTFVNAPNPAGKTDDNITVLTLENETGIQCIIWNFACHPVGHPNNDVISSHYPGYVRDSIREPFENRIPVLFLQGFSGNTRPAGTTHIHSLKRRLRRWVSGPLFEDFSEQGYRDWCRRVSETVSRAIANSRPISLRRLTKKTLSTPASAFIEGHNGRIGASKISFGNEIHFYFVSAELMVEHGLQLRQAHASSFVMPVGCVGDVIGYLPTQEIHKEGGYEGGGFTKSFGTGPLKDDVGNDLNEFLAELIK